jgi:GT2 family glycosyltransferase
MKKGDRDSVAPKPLVLVILLNWNGRSILYKGVSILETVLTGLKNTNYNNFKVIMSDGNSSDDSIKLAEHFDIETVKTENISFANNCNEAILYSLGKYPDAKYIALLNDDLALKDRMWLKKMVEPAESDGRVGVVGCKLIRPNERRRRPSAYATVLGINVDFKRNRPSGYTSIVIGACILLRREMLEKIGLMDEVYRPASLEDADLCKRAEVAGYKVYFRNDTDIVHLGEFNLQFCLTNKDVRCSWREDLPSGQQRNLLIYSLRYHKVRAALFLILEFLNSFLGRKSKGHLFVRSTREVKESISKLVKQIKSAFALYKTNKNRLREMQNLLLQHIQNESSFHK